MPDYVAYPEPERRLIRFIGPAGAFRADLVRGALSEDLCRAFKALALPHAISRVRRSFRAMIPQEYLGVRNDRKEHRRVMVVQELLRDGRVREAASLRFRQPAGVATPIPLDLEKTLKSLFKQTERPAEAGEGVDHGKRRQHHEGPVPPGQALDPGQGDGPLVRQRAVSSRRGRQPEKGVKKNKGGRPRTAPTFKERLAARMAKKAAEKEA